MTISDADRAKLIAQTTYETWRQNDPFGQPRTWNDLPRESRDILTMVAIAALLQSDADRLPLFYAGEFLLHSGQISHWKIECDALTNLDWVGLATLAAEILPPYGEVVGIPHGGIALANALRSWPTRGGPRLIVDDVLTTGKSMIAAMNHPDDIGLVVFARGPLPPRVTALFSMPAAIIQSDADRALSELHSWLKHRIDEGASVGINHSELRRWKAAIVDAVARLQSDADRLQEAREDEKAETVFVVTQDNHVPLVFADRAAAKAECDIRNVKLRGPTAFNSNWGYREIEVRRSRNGHRPAEAAGEKPPGPGENIAPGISNYGYAHDPADQSRDDAERHEQSSRSGPEPTEAEIEAAYDALMQDPRCVMDDDGRNAMARTLRAAYALRSNSETEPADPERSRHKAGMNGPGSVAIADPDYRAALVKVMHSLRRLRDDGSLLYPEEAEALNSLDAILSSPATGKKP